MKRSLKFLLLTVFVMLAVVLLQVKPVAAYAVPQSRDAAITEFKQQLVREGKPAGTYEVEITYGNNGRTLTETVLMTITDVNTVVNGNIAIDAADFVVSQSQVTSMDNAAWLKAAEAQAWRTDTQVLLNVQADTGHVVKAAGIYPVTFVTDGGVQTTVNVQVVDSNGAGTLGTQEPIQDIYVNNAATQIQENVVTDTTFLWGAFGTWIDTAFSVLILIAFLIPITILLVEYSLVLRVTKQLMQLLQRK
ncbi:hypothetical protein [Culicoidibacter larvae]|uniref:Uncharacterized protein n=1 Tax=Culicoidibacter larvae TaxID=2579976 RepID=A0A5R8QBH4_9FIRM|nr:hypothetical protein [Culicoidibacter larvae]TLG73009.1 hypothetical protein FEZ08_08160 [Culicoidibacter larvae]